MSDYTLDAIDDEEIDFLARTIIAQHGEAAALAAEHHLDQLLQSDSPRCETWIAVIDAIHMIRCRERSSQRTGAVSRTWQHPFPR
jgi:hypothetical protein